MWEAIEKWITANSTVLSVLGRWFSGVATLLAVGFALYLQRRIERRNRPRIALNATSSGGSCIRYLDPERIAAAPANEGRPRREELWLRLWLQNESPAVARDVTLKLVGVERDGGLENRPRWPFKLSNLDETSIGLLPRGFDQPVDIAYVRNIEGVNSDAQLALVLVKPPQRPWQEEKDSIEGDTFYRPLHAGATYRISLVALSSNADAAYFTTTIMLRMPLSGPVGELCGEGRLRTRLAFTAPQLESSRFKRLKALRVRLSSKGSPRGTQASAPR